MNMNPFSPSVLLHSLARNHYLMIQLVKRDVLLKYRGAFFGVLWVFLNPLILLAVYTFVFGYIFPSRWHSQGGGGVPNAIMLFAGLITFTLFSDSVSRAPASVRSNPSYVKKIIFPLEILPVVPLGTALVHMVFNMMILFVALVWLGQVHWQLLLIPVLLLPLLPLILGLAWFLAAWGVFIKDMSQIVPVMVQMMMFLSPVFYPVSSVPHRLQPFLVLNPLVPVLENIRAAVLGVSIAWGQWAVAFGMGMVVFVIGLAFFQHSREEFADVI